MNDLLWQQPADMPLGIAKLSKLAFEGTDLGPLRSQLLDKYIFEPNNAAALMDLATVEQLFGNEQDGIARQNEALQCRRIYRSPCAQEKPALRVLALAAPGDIGNNTPLEFLLEGSDIALATLYVVPGSVLPAELPEHDVAIVTACESDDNRAVLQEIARLLPSWPRPVLNQPDRIATLARERLHGVLKTVPGLVAPATVRIDRTTLGEIATDRSVLQAHLPDGVFPLIARPLGSHAGRGLERLDDEEALGRYLAARPARGFYISSYIDYRSPDGLFRKYRVVFIGGKPYACHMAIGDQWMLYYLNAGMAESAAKKIEEERFMTRFDYEFGERHRAALAAIGQRVGLDYFGIDCAQTAEGKLLLFEADVAMIVHLMDSPVVFPYKAPQMRKLFADFGSLLKERALRSPARRLDSVA
jgi:glutathione synthase/RimK-type ligase-like ATP-grasp enzyme